APSSAEGSSDVPLVAPVTGAGVVIARDTGGTVVRAKAARAPGDTLRDSIRIRVLNLPASVVLSDDRDTLTALGQSVTYTGAVLNGRGNVISGYPITWSSSNAAAVTVSPSGVVTAVGFGSAFVIGRAGGVADTVTDVVVNPTRVVVDNTTVAGPRFGTRKRPYAKIRDGVNAADVDDTVLVRKGVAPYSETVALTRRVTLLGDDSAFALSVPRDPLLLPLVSHDTGASGIRVRDATGVVVDSVTIQTVDSVGGVEPGAGIRVLRGSGNVVRHATVRGTQGPQILVDSSPSASLTLNDLAGRQRLMFVRAS